MFSFFKRHFFIPEIVSVSHVNASASRRWTGKLIDLFLFANIFFIPLFFLPSTLDALELPKQSLFCFLVLLALLAWFLDAWMEKRLVVIRSWLFLVILLFLVGYTFLSAVSVHPYVSFLGSFGYTTWSWLTLFVGALFAFLCAERFSTVDRICDAVFVYLASSFLVAITGLFQLFGIFLFPSPLTHISAFTPVGSVFSLAMYVSVSAVASSILLFHGCKDGRCLIGQNSVWGKMSRLFVALSFLVFGAVLVIVDFTPAWIVVLTGTLFVFGLGLWKMRAFCRRFLFILPAVLAVVSIVFLVIRTPIQVSLSTEVAPSFSASWGIAQATLQERPLFGSGPATWAYDYARYHLPSVNASPFWAIRFDRSASSFFTLLPTVGLVGMGLWILLLVAVFVKGGAELVREKRDERWFPFVLVFSSWFALVLVSFFYNYQFAYQVLFWLFLGLLAGCMFKKCFVWDLRRKPLWKTAAVLFGFLAVISLVFLWLLGERYVAERVFAQGVRTFQANGSLDAVVKKLQSAYALDASNDRYVRNLSRVHFLRALQTLQGASSIVSSPDAQAEIVLATNLAREAIDRSPANVDNWSYAASVYQALAPFIRGADEFAIKNYLQAQALEPMNPLFPSEIGHLYLLQADADRREFAQTKGAASQAALASKIQDEDQKAFASLRQAIALKSDYLPARYYLGAWYERKNQLAAATRELEQVLLANNRDVGVAFELSLLYYRGGVKEKARSLLEQIVDFDPANANARWYLASLYAEAGNPQKAMEMLRALRAQNPGNQVIEQKLQFLEKASEKVQSKTLPEPLKDEARSSTETNIR